MNITIKDVAKKANVSISTVSNVINKSKWVSPEVSERVLEVVKELGFIPNAIARSLIKKESLLIGVLIPGIENPFTSIFVRVIEKELFKHNYTTLLCNTNLDTDIEFHYLKLLKEKYVDGVVLLTSNFQQKHIEFFEENSIPVLLASLTDKSKRFSSINIDDYQAAYDATLKLIQLGHKEIAWLGGSLLSDHALQRFEGFKQALKDNGIAYFEDSFFESEEYTIQYGLEKGMEIFSKKNRPTAVLCISDMIAIGAIQAADKCGLRVPEDISIMGFDDIPFASAYRPGIATVRQPVYDLGINAAQMLLQQIKEKESYKKEARILPHEIIMRGSCKNIENGE
ncbi:LacI family DNA-binding transcriptional regulator [Bacillus sp. 03113]|uniref:LacI family DNA-binding transcriptional regulator n=1 Tax=Bacillus sp. 03113 TaxID=2578211 RepID=UPI0011438253|nr:LacI family DNA-binding transcriptional regulator [Bacillus sp. 03113]